MLALYRSGRQAEALACYQSFRRMLADELGIEPSARLKDLERRMLRQDPSLELASASPMAPATPPPPSRPATTCPSCGTKPPEGSRFCPSCGADLTEGRAADEMLKLVTVLFADVVGSVARAEALHPEDVRALMTNYFDAMADEIRAEGGTIEKFAGDAIMAVFGAPTAHEDDAVRAVRAARRMLDRLGSWNAERAPAHRLEIHVGVNTGDVVASGARKGEILVVGDAVNVASRLQHVAEPGTIVVGERTARAARPHFELRRLDEPLRLKGKAEPVIGWVVLGERTASEASGLAAPLVGRRHELIFLRTAFDRVCAERRPQLVTLVGDAGVGKSRLVREFVSSLEHEAEVLVGRCLRYGEDITLSPLADMLKAQAKVFETDSASAAAAKIAQLVEAGVDADLAVDRSRVSATLASSLGLRPPDDPLASLDPRDLHHEVIAAWRALLASAARRRPVIAVFEDLHWADSTMLDIVDELAERLDGPILFLCTARPDLIRSRPDWGGGRRSFSSLPLDPLSADDSARLISFLLEADSLSEGTRRRILARSEGNPFFLEEIVRHLIDEHLLVRENGRWLGRERIDDVELPDSVHAVILARLDLLSPEEKRVAQRAAVVGRRFWDGAVAAIAGVDDLDPVLRTLRRREFVVERISSSITGEREFVFKHVLTRDVAYESLPRKERGRAHAAAAEWIEQTSGQAGGDVTELLAHHNDAAYSYLRTPELRRKARVHLLAAAANAHRRFAIEQGERFARRAVELSESGRERIEAFESLGDLHYMAGDAAWDAYGEALAELSETHPAFARLAAKAAIFGSRWQGTMQKLPEVDEVRRVIDAGLRAAANPGSERTLLLVDLGFLLVQREGRRDKAAQAAVREAVAAAEELGDADLLSAALDLVQAQEMHRGRYGEMYRVAQTRNELVARMNDAREIGDTHAMGAWSAQHLGRYREAEAHATASVERARGTDAGGYLHGLTWRVAARFMLGDWDGALADHDEIERVAARGAGELPPPFTMRAYTHAALCHELRGDEERASHNIDLSLRYAERRAALRSGPPPVHIPPLALALARRGRFDEAVDVIPLVPHSGSAGDTLAALCEIAAAREQWAEVSALAAAAREEAAHGELLALPFFADRLEGRAAAALGDTGPAAAFLRRSAEGFASLAAPWEEAWSRLLLAEVLEPDAAVRELAAAAAIFDRLGSVRESERARVSL
jgi:class 3 adenylate cyclase